MEVGNDKSIQTQRNAELIEQMARMRNSDIKKASIMLAHRDYQEKSKDAKTLGTALLIGMPVADAVITASKQINMYNRTQKAASVIGKYAGLYLGATLFFNLLAKGTKSNDDAKKEAGKHPALYLLGGLAAAVLLVPKAMDHAVKFAGKNLGKIWNKFDKSGNVANSLSTQIKEHFNALNGGKIDRTLDKVAEVMVKELKGVKVEKLAGITASLAVIGVVGKHIADVISLQKDVKENLTTFDGLRNTARNIEARRENVQKEIAENSLQEARKVYDELVDIAAKDDQIEFVEPEFIGIAED